MTAMFGHGVFVHQPDVTMDRLGGAEGVVRAMRAMGMSHAWLRVHGRDGAWRTTANLRLAAALKDAGIAVGVWGWCDGNRVGRDVAHARAAIELFRPEAYIADIEPGVRGARWRPADARIFAVTVKEALGQRPLVVSGPGLLDAPGRAVMAAMAESVDAFAPQAYWFHEDPVAHVERCIASWRSVAGGPLVVTAQAFWGEREGWTRPMAEEAVATFLTRFDGWGEIAGLNWWNLAAPDAMSPAMRAAIAEARPDQRMKLR